jgi:hypothetical protein
MAKAFVAGRGWRAVLPTDPPLGSRSAPRLWSIGNKRMFEGVRGLE